MKMINCRDTAQLVSESMDRKLPWRRRLQVRLHLFVCDNCSRYNKQLQIFRRIFKQQSEPQDDVESSVLDAKIKDRLRRIIEKGELPPK